MKTLIFGLSALAIAGFAPVTAQAADLGGYDEGYSDRGPPVEGPRVVRRDYDYYDGPVVTYYAPRYYRPYPYPYYAGYYPYHYRYWGGRGWGGRGYWARGGYWGHRGYGGWR